MTSSYLAPEFRSVDFADIYRADTDWSAVIRKLTNTANANRSGTPPALEPRQEGHISHYVDGAARQVIAPGTSVATMFMDGKAVAGVLVASLQPGRPGGDGLSLADGSFELDRVSYGPTSFLARPYEVVAPKQVEIDRAVVDGVRIELSKLASVRGH